jgi:hypothetical protein
MNYATWKLNFDNSEYGTGPEDAIAELGLGAEGAWAQGEVETGGTILGYTTGVVDEAKLITWEVTNVTQEQALEFCLALNPEAYLLPDGRITVPYEDIG